MFMIQKCKAGYESHRKLFILSLLSAYPSLFHSLKTLKILKTASPKIEMIVSYALIVVETVIMATVPLTIEMANVPHMDVLKPVAIASIAGGLLVSCICSLCLYNRTNVLDENYFD